MSDYLLISCIALTLFIAACYINYHIEKEEEEKRKMDILKWQNYYNYMVKKYDALEESRKIDAKKCFGDAPKRNGEGL